ncbi:MAG TPA: IS110 family transposase [Firmicutes bacterium]|nr:IS110 family transposase [Candidatus Fermentithermobacillaceae bacterium]
MVREKARHHPDPRPQVRFFIHTSRQAASYAALDPQVYQSGDTRICGKIGKNVNELLRIIFVEALPCKECCHQARQEDSVVNACSSDGQNPWAHPEDLAEVQ